MLQPHDVPERWIKYDKEKRKETAEKKNKDEKKSKKSSVNEKVSWHSYLGVKGYYKYVTYVHHVGIYCFLQIMRNSPTLSTLHLLRSKPVRKVSALTSNFSHRVHTCSLKNLFVLVFQHL